MSEIKRMEVHGNVAPPTKSSHGCFLQVPFYGKSGLNAGVMHMNLTRMKHFPGGGWTAANLKAFDTFKRTIKLADQDILNILFHKVTTIFCSY